MKQSKNNAVKRIMSLALVLLMTAIFTLPENISYSYAADPSEEVDPVEIKVEKLLSKMTLSEKVAQMMIVAMPSDNAAEIQSKRQYGGYILFAPDFSRTNPKGMKKLLKSCQKSSKIPMLMGTDEEGGTVVRASLYGKYRNSRFRSPSQVYRQGGYTAIRKDTRKKDEFLKSLGLNTNFGPVADVPNSKGDFIYDRAFSKKAGKTAKFVKLCVKQMGKDNVVSTLKHFPGYGNNGDTHNRIIRDKRKKSSFVERDLKPFASGINAGADMVMVSHVIVNAFDKKNPASLSPKVHSYLRNKMHFEGVIITDGLAMEGITDFVGGDEGKAAVKAVKAGNDMLCVTGDRNKCRKALVKAVKNGSIPKSQINESVRRILRMKIKRGIIK